MGGLFGQEREWQDRHIKSWQFSLRGRGTKYPCQIQYTPTKNSIRSYTNYMDTLCLSTVWSHDLAFYGNYVFKGCFTQIWSFSGCWGKFKDSRTILIQFLDIILLVLLYCWSDLFEKFWKFKMADLRWQTSPHVWHHFGILWHHD